MKSLVSVIVAFLLLHQLAGQIIAITPQNTQDKDQVTIVFDSNLGNKELAGATKVYMHHGVVTDGVDGTAWQNVKGNWGKDDGVGQMTRVSGSTTKWQITFSPTLRQYFGVAAGINIFRISCVFRNADGSRKATIAAGQYPWGTVAPNLDFYINLTVPNFATITAPKGSETYIAPGQSLPIAASISSTAAEIKLEINKGNGYINLRTVTNSNVISHEYFPQNDESLEIRVVAKINNTTIESVINHKVFIRQPVVIESVPIGMKNGVNYDPMDSSKATLVLLAPSKEFVYLVGDMTDWKVDPKYLMKRSPDGQKYWLELNNLASGKAYVYQYWIDGQLKVADPYAHQIADPWNDKFIPNTVFPNLPAYSRTDFGIASVLQTKQSDYTWSTNETNWKKPDVNHLVIYELHLRDFIASHNFKDLTDTIAYLKNLGINAIELMPINEFEGNDSWGYNPSFYFAVDKYYGHKNELKRFIDVCHQNGIAVISDIVFNHSFGQSPFVQMYFDKQADKPLLNNPWFNREYVGPFEWGYDFNHLSTYTEDLVDEVNRFWLEEFRFDGFRFDFTKGFTNTAPGNSLDAYDPHRIKILDRMGKKIRTYAKDAYLILEHFGNQSEESELGAIGFKMWRNKSYDYVPAAIGNPTGSFQGMSDTTHVPYFNSHDERRIAEHCLTEGLSANGYDVKNKATMLERTKMVAAFTYLQPGLKMIWQFDELAYDIDINLNGRTGRKPYVWGANSLNYYDDKERQKVSSVYKNLLSLRKVYQPEKLFMSKQNHKTSGETRRLSYDTPEKDLIIVGNFGLKANNIKPEFTHTGWWYNYFKGDSINVTNVSMDVNLSPGEWYIYTDIRFDMKSLDLVANAANPVIINPNPFLANQTIKITFDATKASNGGTTGLLNSDNVVMVAGVITQSGQPNTLSNVVDDQRGNMQKVGENLWEISILPNQFFNLVPTNELKQIGMSFRNADGSKKGFGPGNSIIFFDVLSANQIVSISPAGFTTNQEITVTFDANQGNRELVGATKVYMHSGVVLSDKEELNSQSWQKVKGNWGTDNGIGLMSPVPNRKDVWQLKITPKSYYNLTDSEILYWIATVFRNADGTKKGTAPSGPILNGIIAPNQDYFIKNLLTVNVTEDINEHLILFPNPFNNTLTIIGEESEYQIEIYDLKGNKQYENYKIYNGSILDLDYLKSGIYLMRIRSQEKTIIRKVIKN